MPRTLTSRVLLVYPRFAAHSFWNYQATCEVVGARYTAAPLGLITVAALLPPSWEVRLVDRNVEDLLDSDLAWADLVMTGGMLPQQCDVLEVIARAHAAGTPVAVGGPDATASPDVYASADFRILGEVEEILAEFVRAWDDGARTGTFVPTRFPDLATSPRPRFDLLKLEHYMHVGVQFSRGCPFNCEFCNVIELNGRRPRLKAPAQVLSELDALRQLGYRGHVDFVDDNLIGNRREVKTFLAELATWNRTHGYPFEFSTEASINLSDDEELLALMQRAGFFAVFVGIETPDGDSLVQTNKRQNTGRDLAASIRRIYAHGMFVNAGFILGFDAEKENVADAMIACIEEAAIPVCMVGLLYALPNTQLSRRLLSEGRLHAESDRPASDMADQCTSGLNYTTRRSRRETLRDYERVLRTIYEPESFFRRVDDLVDALDLSQRRCRLPFRQVLRDARSFMRISWRSGLQDPAVRGPFLRSVGRSLWRRPRGLRVVFSLAALFLHLRPFSQFMDARLKGQIASIDRGEPPAALAIARAASAEPQTAGSAA